MRKILLILSLLWAGVVGATVPNETTSNSYVCNGGATYDFTFKTISQSDLVVTVDGAPLTLGSDYTVTGAGLAAGGTITLTPASKCTSGSAIVVKRSIDLKQTTSFRTQGGFSPGVHENAFDKLAMGVQGIRADIAAGDASTLATAQGYANDAVTGALAGTGAVPSVWAFTGNGTSVRFPLAGATHAAAGTYVVTLSGVMQNPGTDYSIDLATQEVVFTVAPALGVPGTVRSFGYARAVNLADTSVVTANGVSATLPEHLEAGAVSVRAKGAKGDGVVDDLPAFEAAAAAACAAKHLTVRVPAGTYRITAPVNGACVINGVTQGLRFLGDGLRSITQIVVDGTNATDGIVFSKATPYGEGGEVSNLWISAKTMRTSMRDGIRFTNWGHALVENVRILNGARNGLRVEAGINLTLRRVYAFGNQEGANVGDRTGGLSNTTTVRFYDSYFSASVANGATFKGDQILCSGCVFESSGAYGLQVTDLYATTLLAPYFENNTDWHLYVDIPTNVTVLSPFFFSGTKGGIYIKSSSMTTVIGGSFATNVPRTIAIENAAKATILGTQWSLPAPYEWRTVGDAGSAGPIENYQHGWVQLYSGGGQWGTGVRIAADFAPQSQVEATLTYSASITPDARAGNSFVITPTNGTAFTINAPTNPTKGQLLTVRIKNALGAGGTLGAVTWGVGTVFRLSAWTQPLDGFSRSITFRYASPQWIEVSRTPADVPN